MALNKEATQTTIEQQLRNDLEYIKNDLICRQPNGNYMKFSRIGNFLTIINEPKDRVVKYWLSQYSTEDKKTGKNIFEKEQKIIRQALDEKFSTGLISIEEMKDLIIKAKYEPDRAKALKFLNEADAPVEEDEEVDEEEDM